MSWKDHMQSRTKDDEIIIQPKTRVPGNSGMHYFRSEADALKFMDSVAQHRTSVFKAGPQWCVVVEEKYRSIG